MVDVRFAGYTIDVKWPSGPLFKSQWGKLGKRWYANAQVFLVDTATGKEVGDYYGLIIVSPAFMEQPRKGVDLDDSFTYVMNVFNKEALEQEILSRVKNIKAKDWDGLRAQMARHFWID